MENKVGFCSISSTEFPDDMITTGKIGDVRFHGEGKDGYSYLYSKQELENWARKIQESAADEVYVYFNNDIGANAVVNAEQLMEIFDQV